MATRFAVLHSDARMPAINYDEDTEFNEALRARGIIPQRAPTSRSPSPVLARSPSPSLSDLDDLLLTTDDVLPRAVLEQYRATRMREEGVGERNRRYGRVYPIGKGDYTREVTEGSKADLEGESEGEGTGVVCYLFKDSLPGCKLLSPLLAILAQQYPSTKFVSIVSDHCIENYPDKNCPTLLIYRAGIMTGQIVGLGGMGGDKATVEDVERLLFAFRALDLHLKVAGNSFAQFSSKSQKIARDDESESEDDETFVGGGKSRAAKGRGIRGGAKQDSDDEFDL